jgi:Integrase core domain
VSWSDSYRTQPLQIRLAGSKLHCAGFSITPSLTPSSASQAASAAAWIAGNLARWYVVSLRKLRGPHVRGGRGEQMCQEFQRRLRDECLNVSWFRNLWQARARINAWRTEYNSARPHSSLGYRTPEAFRKAWAPSPRNLEVPKILRPLKAKPLSGACGGRGEGANQPA